MRPANERRRYIVSSYLIGWSHTQNDPCEMDELHRIGTTQSRDDSASPWRHNVTSVIRRFDQ